MAIKNASVLLKRVLDKAGYNQIKNADIRKIEIDIGKVVVTVGIPVKDGIYNKPITFPAQEIKLKKSKKTVAVNTDKGEDDGEKSG